MVRVRQSGRTAEHLPPQAVRRGGREALDGALELIAQAGGGEVVSFPNELAPGKRTSSSFLHNGTRAMFEKAGFTFERHIGKSKTVMRKTVPPG